MIAFEDQHALDRYVQRVLLAHLDASQAAAKEAIKATAAKERDTFPIIAVQLLETGSMVTLAVQRAAVLKLPLPVVPR